MKKRAIIILLILCLTLSGCGMTDGCRAKGYDDLTEEQKEIVDFYFDNRAEWDITKIKYGNHEVSGENVMRSVRFVTYGGSPSLHVVYSLNYKATELVQKYFTNSNGRITVAETKYGEIAYGNGEGWSKSWLTTWTDEAKRDELSRLLLNYYKNMKG